MSVSYRYTDRTFSLKHRKAKYIMPDSSLKEPIEEMPTLVHSTSKGFMQSEEDLTDFEPSARVQTSGATEHQGECSVIYKLTLFGYIAHPILSNTIQ